MANRDSPAGLYLSLGILVLGVLAACLFFAPLANCPGCNGLGFIPGRDFNFPIPGGTLVRDPCDRCGGKGRRTIARAWFGRR